jgi:hypothetical protein
MSGNAASAGVITRMLDAPVIHHVHQTAAIPAQGMAPDNPKLPRVAALLIMGANTVASRMPAMFHIDCIGPSRSEKWRIRPAPARAASPRPTPTATEAGRFTPFIKVEMQVPIAMPIHARFPSNRLAAIARPDAGQTGDESLLILDSSKPCRDAPNNATATSAMGSDSRILSIPDFTAIRADLTANMSIGICETGPTIPGKCRKIGN